MNLSDIRQEGVENVMKKSNDQFHVESMKVLRERVKQGNWKILDISEEDYFWRSGLGTTYHIPWRRRFHALKRKVRRLTSEEIPSPKSRECDNEYYKSVAAEDFLDEFEVLFGNLRSIKLIITSTDSVRAAAVIKALFNLIPIMNIQLALYVMGSDHIPTENKFNQDRPQPAMYDGLVKAIPARRRYSSTSEKINDLFMPTMPSDTDI